MPIDVAALRETLLRLSWVKDARVAPVARYARGRCGRTHAPWRAAQGRQADLIDETGHELEPVTPAKARAC
jgi:cell division protein FtsQ